MFLLMLLMLKDDEEGDDDDDDDCGCVGDAFLLLRDEKSFVVRILGVVEGRDE